MKRKLLRNLMKTADFSPTLSSKIKNIKKHKSAIIYTFLHYLLKWNKTNLIHCKLPFSHFPNIRKIRVNIGQKNNYFPTLRASALTEL